MIQNSFIFLDRVSYAKEQRFWQQGINTWTEFLQSKVKGVSMKTKKKYDVMIRLAKLNLVYENLSFFAEILPKNETWRLYNNFKDKALYLDIETSGYDVTVVGLADNIKVKQFVKGINMNKKEILDEIYKHKLIITFNGSSFDIPVLNKFLKHKIKVPHIDIRHVCSRVGLKGGLKVIEKRLNIERRGKLKSMIGSEAVYCWELWKHTNDKRYLKLLLDYNKADTLNLKPLAEYAINRLWKKVKGC